MKQKIVNGLPKLFDCDDIEFPSEQEICHRCHGKGSHVNPNIDGNGISPEEFREDPDFEESYFSGVYDVPCEECNGNKIVAVPIREGLSKDDQERLDDWDEYRNELAQERRMRDMGIEY